MRGCLLFVSTVEPGLLLWLIYVVFLHVNVTCSTSEGTRYTDIVSQWLIRGGGGGGGGGVDWVASHPPPPLWFAVSIIFLFEYSLIYLNKPFL